MSKSKNKIEILDTSFRDGIQGDNKKPVLKDAVSLVCQMVSLGFKYVELGFVGDEYTEKLTKKLLEKGLSKNLTIFGRTRKPNEDVAVSSDAQRIVELGVKTATIVCKSRLMDVENALKTDAKTNLEMISDTVEYLKKQGLNVILDLEHAVDAFYARGAFGKNMNQEDTLENRKHFLDIIKISIKAKADLIVICDTNGKASPEEIKELFKYLFGKFKGIKFGFHGHNDRGLAIANSRSAVLVGVRHIQGTVDGSGERCGNTSLAILIPDLQINDNFSLVSSNSLKQFTDFVDKFILAFDRKLFDYVPYVGKYAFSTRAGMHISGETRQKGCYTFCNPELVGNRVKIIVDGQSGRSGIALKASKLGFEFTPEQIDQFLVKYKIFIANGGFADSEASFELACNRVSSDYKYPFVVNNYSASTSNSGISKVKVKLLINEKLKEVHAEGIGIFDALFKALQQGLSSDYPGITKVNLLTYDSSAVNVTHGGSESLVRVLIRFSSKEKDWSIVGMHANSIQAGFDAIVDGFYYFLI